MAPLPLVCCLASQACQVAAVVFSLAGTAGLVASALFSALAAAPVSPRVSRPQAGGVVMASVSGIWFGTALNGLSLGLAVKASYIGVAAATFSFDGWGAGLRS